MDYCEDKGIPHKEFLARWDNEDRAKVIAKRLEKAARCTRCGTAEWEWEDDPDAYGPSIQHCHGCARLDAVRDEVKPGQQANQLVLTPKRALEMMRALPVRRPKRRRD